MAIIGHVDAVWRYPVKSMRGEQLSEAFVGFSGVYGDRLYAVKSSRAPVGFPYLTARELGAMLRYRPRFRHPDRAAKPLNLAEADAIDPGITPVYAGSDDLAVDVETPSGDLLAIDDAELVRRMSDDVGGGHTLALVRSERAMTDCRPISLISVQTARQIGDEVGLPIDTRRFRANIYVNLRDEIGFAEDRLVGRMVKLGPKATLAILERDPRCKMITLDPDTSEPSPAVIKKLAETHETKAGVYAAVLVEGTVKPGDEITLI